MQTEETLKQLLIGLLDDKEVRGVVRGILLENTDKEPALSDGALSGAEEGTGTQEQEDSPEKDRPLQGTQDQSAETYRKKLEELRTRNQDLRDRLRQSLSDQKKAIAERDRLSVQAEDANQAHRQELSRLQHVYEQRMLEQERAEQSRTAQIKAQLGEMQFRYEEAQKRYEDAERRVSAEQERSNRAEAERRAAVQKTQVLDSIARPFQDLLSCYTPYRALDNPGIKRLLPDTDPVLFLSAGCQRETVTHLWDALRDVCEGDRPQGWEVLLRTLRYLIDRYNSTMSAPVWSLMDAEQGKPFQEIRHTRSSRCSRYQGTVEQVLLPGIWNNNRNLAERKTVVYFG